MPDTVGRGVNDSKPSAAENGNAMAAVNSLASNGYIRSQLLVLNGGGNGAAATGATAVAATAGDVEVGAVVQAGNAAVAIRAEVAEVASPQIEKIREARMKGYEGDACGNCGNFTLVRNGTCMKCDTCGETSGCS